MKVHVLKTFYHDKLGKVKIGKVVELPDTQAKEFLERGAVERYETKVIRQDPLPVAGVVTPSSALPVAQVSTKMTLKKSGRGRPAKK
jgi:hypothetical protein